MFSKIQINGRSVVSFLLAVMMVGLATAPALAWFEEGEVNGQAARPCRLIWDDQGVDPLYCFQVTPHQPRPIAEQPVVRPAIARAEQMFMPDQWLGDSLAQFTSER